MQTYKLLKKDTVLLCQPHLIDHFGKTGALFLSQINYWLQNNKSGIVHNNERWIFNTSAEWAEQLRISTRSVNRYLKKFLDLGLIKIQKLSRHKSNRTNYITLNYSYLETINKKIIPDNKCLEFEKQKTHNGKKQGTHIHEDKMSHPCGQDGTMVIHKITNIDKNNKSIQTSLKNKNSFEKSIIIQNKIVQVEENLSVDKNIKEKGREKILFNTTLQTPSNTTVQDMLKDWNKVFPESQVVIKKELAKHLFAAFSLKCDKNMMKWKNYLDRLKSSEFIMSDKFKLSLDWALKFKTIDRIFKGDLGVKDIAVQLNQASEEKKSMDHIENTEESLKCQHARSLILSKIGAIKYNAWFTKVNFVEREGRVQMKAESKFVEDYVMQHFGHLFL